MTNTAAASSPSTTIRWRIVLLLMGYAAIAHFNRVGISVAGSEVFIQQLGITETRMGWVYTAFLIVYTLGGLVWFLIKLLESGRNSGRENLK